MAFIGRERAPPDMVDNTPPVSDIFGNLALAGLRQQSDGYLFFSFHT